MSEATDLIAEVKRSVARVERGIANFEKDVEVVGAWTDLAQLRIAAQRLHLFEDSLRARRVDLENATAPEAGAPEEAEVASEPEPQSWSQSAGVRPLSDADLAGDPPAPAAAAPDVPQSDAERQAAEQLAAAGVAAPGEAQQPAEDAPAAAVEESDDGGTSEGTGPQD